MGLFFITVGASIDFGLLGENVILILALTFGLIALKALVLLILSYVFRVGGSNRWLFALGLAQAGEFGFVLLSFTVANKVIPPSIADKLLLVVALSMLLTPLLFILYDKAIAPRFVNTTEREADVIDEHANIIIAGIGRFAATTILHDGTILFERNSVLPSRSGVSNDNNRSLEFCAQPD